MSYILFLFFAFTSPLCAENAFLYHGSATDGIKYLEPRLRYTPGEEFISPAGVYASDLPAFAAAHSFPWTSNEGIDLYVDGKTVVLEIPSMLADSLQRNTYIYVVDRREFAPVECEYTGHTFRATTPVHCLEMISFPSVIDAIEYYEGRVVIKAMN